MTESDRQELEKKLHEIRNAMKDGHIDPEIRIMMEFLASEIETVLRVPIRGSEGDGHLAA